MSTSSIAAQKQGIPARAATPGVSNAAAGPAPQSSKCPHHPHRATQSQQHPEYIPAPVRCSRIDQQAGVSDQRDKALHYVAKRAQRWALFQIERDPGVNSEENGPGGQKQGDSAGIRHSFTYTLFYGRERKRSGSDSLDHSVMITQPRDNHPTSTFRSTGGGGGIRTPAALAGSTV